jgi:hypothetical protein
MSTNMQIASQLLVDPAWPREVGMILSAMEVADVHEERRDLQRLAYRVRASLRLHSDVHGNGDRELYTRDVNPRSLGFITPHFLPLGYGGILQIPTPGGRNLTVHCTLLRCRQVTPGWYEGALYFNRDQNEFAAIPQRNSEN